MITGDSKDYLAITKYINTEERDAYRRTDKNKVGFIIS